MFDGVIFYHQITKNTLTAFARLFSDIKIARQNSSGDIEQTIAVPLAYMNKDKMLRRVDADPDLTVVVFGSTESDMHVSNPSWSPSLNSIATGVAVGSQSWLVTKGTLVVDLLDAKTTNSVWRGQATQTLDRGPTGDKAKDAKNVEKPIRNAVKKMFKQFPHPSRK